MLNDFRRDDIGILLLDLCSSPNSQFAMTFSNLQVRLNEAGFCEQNGVDKHRVLTELLHAFGIMAFKEFSATLISLMKCMFFLDGTRWVIGFILRTLAVSSGGNASGSDCGCMM